MENIQGFVLSREAPLLQSIESQPSTQVFVRRPTVPPPLLGWGALLWGAHSLPLVRGSLSFLSWAHFPVLAPSRPLCPQPLARRVISINGSCLPPPASQWGWHPSCPQGCRGGQVDQNGRGGGQWRKYLIIYSQILSRIRERYHLSKELRESKTKSCFG